MKECLCGKIKLDNEVVARDWRAECPEHGIGTDWYEHGGKQYHEAYRAYTIELQALAREARRTGKSQSHLVKPPPQYKDLRGESS